MGCQSKVSLRQHSGNAFDLAVMIPYFIMNSSLLLNG